MHLFSTAANKKRKLSSSEDSSSSSFSLTKNKGFFLLLLLSFLFKSMNRNTCKESALSTRNLATYGGYNDVDETYFIPGAGFSGFWYAFGRLKAIENPASPSKSYHCFSAGCLAITSTLLNKTFEDISSLGLNTQARWKNGVVHRYDVVEEFVDNLLIDLTEEQMIPLRELNIVTTNWGMSTITNPKTKEELRELLVDTAFIPFATGFGFTRAGGAIDGGFSVPFHPKCDTYIGLPITFRFLSNVLNVNMGMDLVTELYEEGLAA